MNIRIIQSMLSHILLGAGAVLLLPLLLSLYYGGPVLSFLIPALLSLLLYLLLRRRNLSPNVSLTPWEGTAITALSWIAVSLLYAIPYICSGTLSPLDGLVESVSGLTGTGATVINDLSPLPPSILFFRAMTHWLGGLGIIVIFVALFPQAGRGTTKMVNAESTGPTSSKPLPRIKETALALFCVYFCFTASLVLQGHMPLPESLREALFQSASLSSTTGYVSADFDQWPSFAKFILLLIIIAGGCGGSTAGGLKVMRLILLFKCFSAILKLHMHPRAVFHMTVGKEKFSRNTVL